jgi:hypothetical protein
MGAPIEDKIVKTLMTIYGTAMKEMLKEVNVLYHHNSRSK